MKLTILTCLWVALAAEVPRDYHNAVGIPQATRLKRTEKGTSRIVGGYYSYLSNQPFFGGLIISLTSGLISICGSTLVTTTRLVTAAHCWHDGVSSGNQIEVVLGSIRLFSGGTRFLTNTVIPHNSYDPNSWENDIAIVLAPLPIETSFYIKPITLPESSNDTASLAIAVGFGRDGDWAGITIDQRLKMHYLDVIENEACNRRYGVNGSIICTAGGIDSSPCDGDSGGPLYFYSDDYKKSIFLGVLSFGSRYGCQVGHPYVHTKVASHLDFILETS